MLAVIFEVQAKPGQQQDYLDLAAGLRPLLARQPGFISIERFQSLSEPGKILSLSFWRDAASVEAWRQHQEHREGVLPAHRAFQGGAPVPTVQVVVPLGLKART